MNISFRPAESKDLKPAAALVQSAYNDLRTRHGLAATIPLRPPLFQEFCLVEGPEGLWIAEAEGNPVGFGFAWARERFWYLAQIFVAPDFQSKGIGQALLSRTLQLAERVAAENLALMTMAYNTASTGLYIRNGLYPREPLLRMKVPATIVEGLLEPSGLDLMPIGSWPEAQKWLKTIDEEVLGFSRDTHHSFLLGGFAANALRIERAGQPVGYASFCLHAPSEIGATTCRAMPRSCDCGRGLPWLSRRRPDSPLPRAGASRSGLSTEINLKQNGCSAHRRAVVVEHGDALCRRDVVAAPLVGSFFARTRLPSSAPSQ